MQTKPGWKTSSFWISMAAIALPLLLPLLDGAAKSAPTNSLVGILGAAIVAAGYSLARSITVKAKLETNASMTNAQTASGAGVSEIALQVAQEAIPPKYASALALGLQVLEARKSQPVPDGELIFRDKTGDGSADEIPAQGEGFIENGHD